MSTAEKIAKKVYADLFPDRYDETVKITKKIADIIAAEIAAEAKDVAELVRACRVVLDNLGCNYEGELEEALKPFEAATAQGE